MRQVNIFSLLLILAVMVSLGASTSSAQADPLAMPLVTDSSILSTYQEAQADPELSEKEKIKRAIDTYFKLKYEGQKRLDLMDFSTLVADTSQSRAWADEEMNKREIELYMGKNFSLNYLDYDYSLAYQSIQLQEGSRAVAQLEENHQVVFEVSAPEISKLANLEHTITLEKSNDKWVIVSDEYQDELASLLTHQSRNQILENIKNNTHAHRKSSSPAQADNTTGSTSLQSTGDWHNLTSSDRNSIANYADYYWENYNSNYRDFTDNDCTNFVSQAMYEWSSIPMDAGGSLLWYYYSGSNYSYSWTVVADQYYYLSNNAWTGPKGHKISSLCDLEKADIVQGSDGYGNWEHEVLIVQYNGDYCWYSENYLYDAHDEDRYHYPLSNMYVYPYLRFISLDGYYE